MPYIPHTQDELKDMLNVIGVRSLEELFADIPKSMRPKSFDLPTGKAESEVCSYLEKLAHSNNVRCTSFLGAGFYNHSIPKVIDTLANRGEFVTAYTPYQAEVSQGTLQAIFEYQTAVARLTELDCANASVYDGGSALFEAIMMSVRATGKKRIVIDSAVSPIWLVMLKTFFSNLDIELVEIEQVKGMTQVDAIKNAIDETTASVVVQNPNFFGNIYDFTELFSHAHDKNALAIIAIQPIMQALLKTPKEMNADIAVADGQSLGLPLSFGGPYLGMMACTKKLVRQLPGRIVGKTKDLDGKDGYVLTLQAREQHIRRAKATSNICSNQALCALRSLIYMSVLGSEGMERVALLSMENTHYLVEQLTQIKGISRLSDASTPYSYEVALELPINATEFIDTITPRGFIAGVPLGKYYKGMEKVLLICCTEQITKNDIDDFITAVKELLTA